MKRPIKTEGTKLVTILMIRNGWDYRALAKKLCLDRRNMANQIALNFPARKIQAKVEDFFTMRIFTEPDEYARRAELKILFGFDPFQETNSKLRNFASDQGIFIGQAWRKPKIISVITAALTARENPTTQQTISHKKS